MSRRPRTDEQRARAAAWQREYRLRNLAKINAYRSTDEYRERNATRARRDYAENRGGIWAKQSEKSRAYRERYPEKTRLARRARDVRLRMGRHGPRIEEWIAEALIEQDGRCYLCGDQLGPGRQDVAIDHDHTCCEAAFSCSACRRGLACQRCNRLIGMAFDDPALLRRIADALEVALSAAQSRIATKPLQPSLLEDVPAEEVP